MSYDLELVLEVSVEEKKFLIGSGGVSPKTKADISFMRMRYRGSNKLFIPGSTIKGVLRTSLIRTAHLIGKSVSGFSVHPSSSVRGDIVSSLFGWVSWPASKLIVESAYVDSQAERMAHVRINDKSRTAEEGALFVSEYLPHGSSFKVRVIGRGLTPDEARALFLSILEMNYERMGRAGLAKVRIFRGESRIPPEIEADPLVKEILEGIGV